MTILLGGGHTFYRSLVTQAIHEQNDQEALRLLTIGYSVPSEENRVGTLQQIFLKCPNPKLTESIIAKLTVEKINAIDISGDNALMTAAKCRNIAAINLLIAAKADVNLADGFLQTPLHQVMNRSCPLNPIPRTTILDTVHCLFRHGASTKIVDKFGKTAIQTYVYTSDYDPQVISLLVSEGDDPPYDDVKIRPPNHALKLTAAIQTGLDIRKTAVTTALTYVINQHLRALINEYV